MIEKIKNEVAVITLEEVVHLINDLDQEILARTTKLRSRHLLAVPSGGKGYLQICKSFGNNKKMASKMKKGLLKPIRYLSQIFDVKEPELQIGFPTDVRHVGHIGIDGSDMEGPTWMKEFHSSPLPASGVDGSDSPATTLWASSDLAFLGGMDQSSARTSSSSIGPTLEDFPNMSPNASPSQPRRRSDVTDSSVRARRGRRYRKKEGIEAPTDSISGQELPAVPKKSHRRKIKDSDGNKSPGPSRLRECSSGVVAKERNLNFPPHVINTLDDEGASIPVS
ncbi:hypothetical protein LUZ60_014922 [Juncus effusus]|nr:hypothetical protein LUZ60_014922 [Juncus effusus]